MAALFAKRGVDVDRLGMEAVAGHDVDEAIATLGGVDVEVEPLVIEGHPAQVLLEWVRKSSPAVVVPPGWVAGSTGGIVVEFDASEKSQAAWRWAIEFAAGAPVRSLVAIILTDTRRGPKLLGSVSTWMLHDATCPTVVVPRAMRNRWPRIAVILNVNGHTIPCSLAVRLVWATMGS